MSGKDGGVIIKVFSDTTATAVQSGGLAVSIGDKILGDLRYRLAGLLILQTLYATLLEETAGLKARLSRQEADSTSNAKDDVTRASKTDELSAYSDGPTSSERDPQQHGANSSLFSSFYRAMQSRLTTCEQLIADMEGTTAKGLIQVTNLCD